MFGALSRLQSSKHWGTFEGSRKGLFPPTQGLLLVYGAGLRRERGTPG